MRTNNKCDSFIKPVKLKNKDFKHHISNPELVEVDNLSQLRRRVMTGRGIEIYQG